MRAAQERAACGGLLTALWHLRIKSAACGYLLAGMGNASVRWLFSRVAKLMRVGSALSIARRVCGRKSPKTKMRGGESFLAHKKNAARSDGIPNFLFGFNRKGACYARSTLPAFMHFVQMLARRTWPFSRIFTFWMFGRNIRLETRWEWLTLRPATGFLPHTSQI